MPWWKALLLNAYYHGTLPYRVWRNARDAAQFRAPVMILFYHRVADMALNDWTCPTDVFVDQMRWLREHFDLVTLAEAQHRISSGCNARPCVHVTFDDGYEDNCRVALPLLIEQQIPCTYFVASQFVIDQQPFPHDVKAGEPLAPNTPRQLREMVAAGIEVAAHTRNHADLGQMTDLQMLEDEIVGSRNDLEAIIGQQVRYFAFPFGMPRNMSQPAFQTAYEAGFEAVCSAYGAYNWPSGDSYHLQRIHGDPDLLRLKNWTTVDPNKRRTRKNQPLFVRQPFHEEVSV